MVLELVGRECKNARSREPAAVKHVDVDLVVDIAAFFQSDKVGGRQERIETPWTSRAASLI